MAVDSHADNQYALTIDNVNNNNLEKSLESYEADDSDTELSLLSLSQPYSPGSSALSTSSGSSRRKNNSISRLISIKEYRVTPETSDPLSAIDKLLLKNKAALRNQMKQPRAAKPPKETGAKKKDGKPRKEKVLGSKIAAKKKPTDENKKPVKSVKPKKTEPKSKPEKAPKCDDALKENMPKKRAKQPPVVKIEKKKPVKKEQSEKKKKPLLTEPKNVLKLKKLSKNERKTDLKSFKTNASLKTRSFTKVVKLRNGKSRIIHEKIPATSPNTSRKAVKRSICVDTIEVSNKETTCKRPIEQEPLGDHSTILCKKRKTITTVADEPPPLLTEHVNGDLPAQEDPPIEQTSIKEEFVAPIKQECVLPENNIEEINVVKKETNSQVLFGDTNIETKPSNVSYVLQDLGSYVKEIERKTSKSDTPPSPIAQSPISQSTKQEVEIIDDSAESENEFPLQETFTETEDAIDENITLQLSDEIELDNRNDMDKESQPDIQPEPSIISDQQDISIADPCSQTPTPSIIEEQPVASQIVRQEEETKPSHKENKEPTKEVIENNIVKESILGALGLGKVNQKPKDKERDNYTGTLKAVIKIDKGCRRMELMQRESSTHLEGLQNETVLSFYSKIQNNSKSDTASENTNGIDKSSDSVPGGTMNGEAYRNKSHDDALLNSIREANISNMETDYNGTADTLNNSLTKDKTKAAASLVVPEKSSSFSIHPNRLCSDVCKYCFGKFGSLDTPCHVAQLKNPERQRKILLCEPNLKMDTCLCDACYRYVDRKANKPPTKRNKNMRRSISINQRTVCVIQNCNQFARHMVKRKWLLRISKKIGKLSFDVNKGGTRMRYGLCSQHYYLVDYYTLCGICKKRLNRNHMYSIRSELNDLNEILREDSIPIKLLDNMLLCKLCHYYMSLRLKYGEASKMSPSNRQYYKNFRKKVLCYYNVTVSDIEDMSGSEGSKMENGDPPSPVPVAVEEPDVVKEPAETKRSNGNSKKNHNVGIEDIANLLKPLEGDGDKNSARIQVKFGNLNIGKLSNLNIGQNTQTEVKHDKLNDKELPLIADFCFETPCSEPKIWEKCVSTIQFDKGTKKLWQDLQKPYGNQSSFIRHLIMLEKYWRSGSLVLSENADAGAVKYINSVKNRIESLETSSSTAKLPPLKPANVTPPAQYDVKAKNADGVVRRTPEPPPLLKIDQMSNMAFNAARKMSDNQPAIKMVNASSHNYNSDTISLSQYKEMMHPQPRTKQLTQVPNCNGQQLGVSLLKKIAPTESLSSAQVNGENLHKLGLSMLQKYATANATYGQISNNNHNSGIAEMMRKYALPSTSTPTMPSMRPLQVSSSQVNKAKVMRKNTQYVVSNSRAEDENMPKMAKKRTPYVPRMEIEVENNINSSIIAKLPKALTVTAVDEPVVTKIEEKPRLIPAPFLAGEKPSVTVFREISK